ncbi:hypothetical protein SAMN05444000_105195 [Shimia gijangensis]|uniref:Uncharacterized protein n=1 Tax=Shimia gijangensis TaxID=1470563 RepID=A0A1M6H1M6_9RHOB|nr:hypothetical protein [Shimia gijangensis]SHJ16121.1 hypothetical protein SAMN05444000_105195 [Shimia gijangensis]
MSDPVTNVEIEDVLTSIRRLVSENSRAGHVNPVPVEQPDAEPAHEPADRLMLTPALRVSEVKDESELDEAHFDEDVEEAAEENSESWQHDDASFEGTAEDEADHEVEDNETHYQADTSVEETWEDTDEREDMLSAEAVVFFDDDSGDPDEATEVESIEAVEAVEDSAEEALEDFDDDEGIALSDAQVLDSRIVQWGHIGAVDQPPYEPDAAGDSDYAGTDVSALSWGASATSDDDETPLTLEAEIEPLEEFDAPFIEISEEDTPEFEENLELSAAEDEETMWESDSSAAIEESAVAEDLPEDGHTEEAEQVIPMFIPGSFRHATDVNLHDRGDREMDVGATDLPGEHSVQGDTETNDFTEESFEEAIAPEMEGFDPDDTAFLDEAMMRDLVGEIVRQELQGALGERITRNVRKLVRREIHRALAAHELE